MNNFLKFILILGSLASMAPQALANPNDMIFASDFEHYNVRPNTPLTNTPGTSGPLQKAEFIVNRGAKALRYIARDAVVDGLNNVSSATNNLVKHGVQVNHTHIVQKSLIPQIGFAAVGFLASACGLGVITYTALQKDQKNAKSKYLAGASMLAVGIASLVASYWLSIRG